MKKALLHVLLGLLLTASVAAQGAAEKQAVIETIKRFYAGFDNGSFPRAEEYTTVNWVHINPSGGRTTGRDATLKDVRGVHATFLKGVTDTPESFDVSFAGAGTAVVVVPSRLSTFTAPNGAKFENQRCIRTFVVTKRNGRWRIMLDHNTFVQ